MHVALSEGRHLLLDAQLHGLVEASRPLLAVVQHLCARRQKRQLLALVPSLDAGDMHQAGRHVRQQVARALLNHADACLSSCNGFENPPETSRDVAAFRSLVHTGSETTLTCLMRGSSWNGSWPMMSSARAAVQG